MTEQVASGIAPAEGVAFPLGVRLMATAVVAAMFYWAARASGQWLAIDMSLPSLALFSAALLLVLWCLAWMWRSRTRVDADGVEQTWIWTKKVRWADVTQARLIGVPGLEWLITPRLVVRPRGGGVVIFHSADRKVLAAFAGFVTLGARPDALKT